MKCIPITGQCGARRELRGQRFHVLGGDAARGERGAQLFDFGRSKQDTGSYHFKKHWGFEPRPLPYAYYLVRATTVPNISPTNRKYRLFIQAWRAAAAAGQ